MKGMEVFTDYMQEEFQKEIFDKEELPSGE